jgi:hypothetical protein
LGDTGPAKYGWSHYPDAEIQSRLVAELFGEETSGGVVGVRITEGLTSDAKPSEITAFYRDQFEQAGFEVTGDMNSKTGAFLIAQHPSGDTVSFFASMPEPADPDLVDEAGGDETAASEVSAPDSRTAINLTTSSKYP